MRVPHQVKNLTPRQFEEFVAETLAQLGFRDVILTPRSRGGGKDVIARHKISGYLSLFILNASTTQMAIRFSSKL